MADDTLYLKQNDLQPVQTFTCTVNDVAADLTGATSATLKMRSASGSTTVSRTGTITDAANGVVQVTFMGTDTAVAEAYQAEIEVVWPTSKPQTFPNDGYFTIVILDDLG